MRCVQLETTDVGIMCLVLLFCAMLWAYITARFVDVVTNADPDLIEFRNRQDDLNQFIQTNSISNESSFEGDAPPPRAHTQCPMHALCTRH